MIRVPARRTRSKVDRCVSLEAVRVTRCAGHPRPEHDAVICTPRGALTVIGRSANSTMVRFIVTGADQMREEAYKAAVKDARQRAERLAKLHSVKLGAVRSVQESFVSSDNTAQVNRQPWEVQDPDVTPPGEINTENMSGAVFQVRLMVQFALDSGEKAAAETASKPLVNANDR